MFLPFIFKSGTITFSPELLIPLLWGGEKLWSDIISSRCDAPASSLPLVGS